MVWIRTPGSRRQIAPKRRLVLESLEDRTVPDTGLLAGPLPVAAISAPPSLSNQFLIRFNENFGPFVSVPGTSLGMQLTPSLFVMHVSGGVSVGEAVAAYQADPRVAYAQPDYVLQLDAIPNDPGFPQLYALNNTGQTGGFTDADIDAVEAWEIFTGTHDVIVAVIDTGVNYNHPDLIANTWVNQREIPGNGIDDDGNGFIDDYRGWDFYSNDNDPMDTNGHGTHVAGTIGAVGNNGLGVTGVNWNVTIMPVRFLGPNGGTTSDAIQAIQYAVRMGATISNNSWGGGGFNQALYDTIRWARDEYDHVFVAAAGNSGANGAIYPAAYNLDNIIAVAASDSRDNLASFSNYGANVDLAAPGVNIYSTWYNGGYNTISGTSMATPHVAGAVALVRGMRPDMNYAEVINQILSTVDVKASLTGKVVSNGRLNVYNALANLSDDDDDGPRVASSTPTGSVTNSVSSVTFTFNENVFNFTVEDVISFTGPGGVDLRGQISSVTGSGQTYTVNFNPQGVPGNYVMVIGPEITDAAGNLMNQDADGINGEIPSDQYVASFSISQTRVYSSTDVPKAIKDKKTITSTLAIKDNFTIRDLDVRLYVTHTWDADLQIILKSPTGVSVTLVSYRGGSGDNFGSATQDTIFDDEAEINIAAGSAPFLGSFRPEAYTGNQLARFDGSSTKGTWTLSIYDRATQDTGSLRRWSIAIVGDDNGGQSKAKSKAKAKGGKVSALGTGDAADSLPAQAYLVTQAGRKVVAMGPDGASPAKPVAASVSASPSKQATDSVFATTPPAVKLKVSNLGNELAFFDFAQPGL